MKLSTLEREALGQIPQLRSMPHGLVWRTQMILLSTGSETSSAIAQRYRVSVPLVAHWRKRLA